MLKVANSVINASQIATPISLPGDVTLSTGNLIPGTAAKGVNFTANTPAAGMTSQLLNVYEEGNWTPTATSITGTNTYVGTYTRIGNRVLWEIQITTSTSIGITYLTSTLTLPMTAIKRSMCSAADYSSGATYGIGLGDLTIIYPPTAAAGTAIVITGFFKVA